MMNATRESGTEMKEEIIKHEQELNELLGRVMGAPLMPIGTKIQDICERMDLVEKMCGEMQTTTEQAASQVGDIHKETEKLKSTMKDIEQSISNAASNTAIGLDKLSRQLDSLASSQSDMQEKLDALEKQLTSQHSQGASQRTAIESALAQVESQFTKGVSQVMQQQQLLSGTSQEQFKQIAAQLAQSMQTELSQAMQGMQRRMIWLSGVCGLSLLGTVGVLLHLFA